MQNAAQDHLLLISNAQMVQLARRWNFVSAVRINPATLIVATVVVTVAKVHCQMKTWQI